MEPSWGEATERVLAEADEPLSSQEIAQRILDAGIKRTAGATPDATVGAQIYESIKKKGDASPFVKIDKNLFQLRKHIVDAAPKATSTVTFGTSEVESEPNFDSSKSLIQAFGISWSRDKVDFKAAKPKLLGISMVGSDPVDFAEQTGVYILYDGARCVYVGRVSGKQRFSTRLREHTRDRLSGRWDRFSWFGTKGVTGDGKLIEANGAISLETLIASMEALLIEGLEPPLNRRQGDALAVAEFIQAEDPAFHKKRRQEMLLSMMNLTE